MNVTLQEVQSAIIDRGYSTTSALPAADDRPVLYVRDSGQDLLVTVGVDDAEASSFDLYLRSRSGVVHGEAHLSNLPATVVAAAALEMLASIA
jgi:hypothetical protein